MELNVKNNSNNILKDLIGKNCSLLINEDYTDSYINYNSKVKVLDVSNSFIKVEYKKGKNLVEKLIDIDIITSIKVVEGDK